MKIELTNLEKEVYYAILRGLYEKYENFGTMQSSQQFELLREGYTNIYSRYMDNPGFDTLISPASKTDVDMFLHVCIGMLSTDKPLDLFGVNPFAELQNAMQPHIIDMPTSHNTSVSESSVSSNTDKPFVSVRSKYFSYIDLALNNVELAVKLYDGTCTNWKEFASEYISKTYGPVEKALYAWCVM